MKTSASKSLTIDWKIVWEYVFEAERTGKIAFMPGYYRDTVNHYFEMRHPGQIIVSKTWSDTNWYVQDYADLFAKA